MQLSAPTFIMKCSVVSENVQNVILPVVFMVVKLCVSH
jgi:hypothetical protein